MEIRLRLYSEKGKDRHCGRISGLFSSIVRVYKYYTLRIADTVPDCPGKGGTAALEEAMGEQWESSGRAVGAAEGAQAQSPKRLIAG